MREIGGVYTILCSPRLLSAEYVKLKEIENFPPHLISILAIDDLIQNINIITFIGGCSLVLI